MKPGAVVRAGQPIMTLFTDTPDRFARAQEALADAVTITADGSAKAGGPVVLERITAS